MSEATDFHPQPRPVAPLRRAQTVPRSRDAGQSPQRGEREGARPLASKEHQRGEREGARPLASKEHQRGEREGARPLASKEHQRGERERSRPSAWEDPEEDPRLEAALSLRNPVYPLDPPIVDVRIPVKEPHAAATAYSRAALRYEFPDAQVGDDLHMLFTEPGQTEKTRLSPDILVALNVRREDDRGDYDADVLGPPDFVLEVVSRSTWRHDVGRKLSCYQQIGVRECLFFDATGEDRAGEGELWGYALTPEYAEPLAGAREGPAPCMKEPLKEVVLPNGKRGVRSEVLGLVAYVAKRTPPSAPDRTARLTMRWHDPATGSDIPDFDQSRAQTRAEKDRADAAENEARALRRQVAELEERLRRRDGP